MSSEAGSRQRYERLEPRPCLDDETSNHPEELPPCYDEVPSQECSSATPFIQGATSATFPATRQENKGFIPPSYEAATALPSYEDVEKYREDEERLRVVDAMFNLNTDEHDDVPNVDGLAIGSDILFFFTFIIAFLFNWIGLFIGYFIMFNLAGRYGALAGFGASMIKWLLFLRYSGCCKDYLLNQHIFTWGVFVLLASVILIRGVTNWLSVRSLQNLSPSEVERHPRFMIFN